MNNNAQHWFKIAIKVHSSSKEAHLGLCTTYLRLGYHQKCIDVIKNCPGLADNEQTKKEKLANLGAQDSDGNSTEPLSCSYSEENLSDSKKSATKEEEDEESLHDQGMLVQVGLNIEDQFIFLKAICYKKLLKPKQSQREYTKLESIFRSRQGFKVAKLVFTNLMLPVQINRKLVENYTTQFLENISILNDEAYFDKNMYS